MQPDTYLEHSVAQLEENNVLHTQIHLYEIHPLRAFKVLESEAIIVTEAAHHIALEMAKQIHFRFRIFGILVDSEVVADENGALPPRANVINMSAIWKG